ncbi:GTP-binding protein REM 2 isoform X2 [Pan paniscus]|uniref:GTP-binding protein REM 2 isoform X2 n=1 Tax=Pan paniscus TaxID=9597 RepID=UPI0004F0173F|nr:GTP-binding protein REM 2 isoform X2 [Pan paniscus]
MHTDLDTDMDMDTETTALCPSGSRQASPPGTPTPEADATLLKKSEKLLAELDRSGLPSAPGAPRRRGSMPVPYKHQLRRAQAVDELDWPPQASSSGSSDSLGSGEAAPAQKDGIFKVMLVGESGVGKSTLAGTFGGLQGDSAHEPENPEDTYERRIMVDKEEVTLVVYDIWEQGDAGGWLRDHCLQTGDAFLIVFSVTDRRSFSKVPETLLRLRAGRPHHDLPVILVGNKSDLARSREVSLEAQRAPEPVPSCRGPPPGRDAELQAHRDVGRTAPQHEGALRGRGAPDPAAAGPKPRRRPEARSGQPRGLCATCTPREPHQESQEVPRQPGAAQRQVLQAALQVVSRPLGALSRGLHGHCGRHGHRALRSPPRPAPPRPRPASLVEAV